MPDYLVIGCLGIDHIILADGTHMQPKPGGNAFYGAAGARLWGVDVGIVALVPKGYPQEWINQLAAAGVDTSGIVRTKDSLGLEGTITYQADGTRLLGATGGAIKFIQNYFPTLLSAVGMPIWQKVCPNASHIPQTYFSARAVFLAAMAYSNQAACVHILNGKMQRIILDPPPLMPGVKHGKPPRDLADLSLVDYILPSEQETQEYFGDGISPRQAAEHFYSLGARNIALKRGSRGAELYIEGRLEPQHVSIYKTKAVDITGAGDSFGAGFMVGLMETGDTRKAACYGAVSASFIIEGFGADHALGVTRVQAEQRLHKLLDGV